MIFLRQSIWALALSTVVLEKTLESPLDCKKIQPVHPKGDQSWVFIGGTDVQVETPILWPPNVKSWLIWKDPDAGKDWGQEEKGTTKDEMVGWHHRLNGCGFLWTPGVGDGQGGLACCGSLSHSRTQLSEWLNWTELNWLDLQISKRVQKKNLLLPYWPRQSLWLCVSQQTVESYSRDRATRPPYLLPEKSVCRSRRNNEIQTWNNRLFPNWERSTSKLYIFTLLI